MTISCIDLEVSGKPLNKINPQGLPHYSPYLPFWGDNFSLSSWGWFWILIFLPLHSDWECGLQVFTIILSQFKKKKKKVICGGAGGLTWSVKHLLCKCENLGSIPSTPLHIIGAGASLSVLVHLCVCTCIHAECTLVKTRRSEENLRSCPLFVWDRVSSWWRISSRWG